MVEGGSGTQSSSVVVEGGSGTQSSSVVVEGGDTTRPSVSEANLTSHFLMSGPLAGVPH